MDPRFCGFSGSMNGIHLGNKSLPSLSGQNLFGGTRDGNNLLNRNHGGVPLLPNDPSSSSTVPSSTVTSKEDPHEDCDFSDAVLRYISQMLMEEDMEDKTCMLQESLDLQAAEKSFYEVLGKKYPPSPEKNWTFIDQSSEIPDYYLSRNRSNCISSSINSTSNYLVDPSWTNNLYDYSTSVVPSLPVYSTSHSSSVCSSNSRYKFDGFLDSPVSPLQIASSCSKNQSVWQLRKGVEEANKFLLSSNELLTNINDNGMSSQELNGKTSEEIADLCRGSQSVCQFRKGVEEASKFLLSSKELLINFDGNGLSRQELNEKTSEEVVKVEKKEEGESSPTQLIGRKNPHREDVNLEEESCSKQAAVYPEPIVRSEMFDEVLLCNMGKGRCVLQIIREALNNGTQSKGPNNGKDRGKKQNRKKEEVDLRTLLIHCAQAVAADDHRSATNLLKQIRQHSYPLGDGNQRMAHYFADGLEARLAGNGSKIYKALVSKRTSAADYLKAYQLYLASCPFRKISNFVSNKTIMLKAENARRLHIIDFGILYGFQWPTFIQRIAIRDGGPPKIRITGIEFPQPGFRPAAGVEETGRRLADYARTFDVPFEYHAIAKKWDTIKLEDLKIDKDEFLVVNCLYRAKTLHDETLQVNSSRNIVINLIRKINPDLFIHGIVNGAYNAPFFVTRFKEVLFHFSALFDMLETNVPREHHQRLLIEREIFGKEALNVIACEGWERVERPETYKQWQVRNLRAGLMKLPFDREIIERATNKVRSTYHKDFVIDEDSQWLLQGWKGRIIYALSCWKPVHLT